MSVERYDFTKHVSGETFAELSFTVDITPPTDLTGATIRMDFNNGEHVFTNGSGITITDAANGIFKINSQIIAWVPSKYTYDLWITLASGLVKKWRKGSWSITTG